MDINTKRVWNTRKEGKMGNKQMNTSLGFVMGLEQILNYLVEHTEEMAQIGNTNIRYLGEKEDDLNTKKEVFEIQRIVKE